MLLLFLKRVAVMDNEKMLYLQSLINRLRGIYTVPVNDGAGLLNGKDTFTQTFDTPPISKEAANAIEWLIDELETVTMAIEETNEG